MERYEKESELTKKAKEQAKERPNSITHLKPEGEIDEYTGKKDTKYTPQENQFADGKGTSLADAFDRDSEE